MIEPGQLVSHYKILELVGGGGMGVVYKAEDTLLKRTVALKFLPPTLTLDPEAQERFIHEAQAASALEHANICSVHEIAEHEGQTFIVMGYYEGKTLKKKIEDRKLKIEDGIDIAIQIAQGLARAHEAGIVHRDIKPANIMVTSHGEVKILDFGLARVSGRTLMTKSGVTLGTAAYMSPEQARGETVDARTDIWSLGVVMYEMLTGHLPFKSDHEQALVYAILNEDPKPIRSLKPDVPEVVDQVVMKALAKKPDGRYQKAEDLLSDLNAARVPEQSGATIAATEVMAKKRKTKRRRILIAAGVILLVLAGVLGIGLPFLQDQAIASNPRTIAFITFRNETGDASLEYLRNALPNLISTSLEESKYFSVLSQQRIADLLRQLGRRDSLMIDQQVGLQICSRAGIGALGLGSFVKAGDLFLTEVQIIDVITAQPIMPVVRSKGTGVQSLLETQVNELAATISRGVGVSRSGTEKTLKPIIEITTDSPEAYNLYMRGVQEFDRWAYEESRRFFQLAVEKDSLFVSAWVALRHACAGLGEMKAAERAGAKAAALTARASEKERYEIAEFDTNLRASLLGYRGATELAFARIRAQKFPQDKWFLWKWGYLADEGGDHEEGKRAYTRLLDLDPFYGPALNVFGYYYAASGDTAKAFEMFRRYAAASPGDPNPYDSMGDIYFERGQEDNALSNFQQALALKPDFPSLVKIAGVYFLREEYDNALAWIDTTVTRWRGGSVRAGALLLKAFHHLWLGRLSDAELVLRSRQAVIKEADPNDANGDFLAAWIAFERHDFVRSRSLLQKWIPSYLNAVSPMAKPIAFNLAQFCLGVVDLAAGRPDSVERRLNEMRRAVPDNFASDSAIAANLAILYSTPRGLLEGMRLLSMGRPSAALEVTPRATKANRSIRPLPVYDGYMTSLESFYRIPVMVDVLPMVYSALGNIDSAVIAYDLAVSHTSNRFSPIFPRYHYRLARLYDRKGMKEKAVEEYTKFLKIWRKADPIYREPADARARLAKLKQRS